MSDDTRDADEAHDLMSERETSMTRKEARTLGASAFERLEAAIGELRKWLDNDDPVAPIDAMHDAVGAFNARDAAPAPLTEEEPQKEWPREAAERVRGILLSAVRTAGDAEQGRRDHLGRIVREVWIAWAREQPNPKASWLVPWEGLAEPDREVDRRIGERLFGIGVLSGEHATEMSPLTEGEAHALAARVQRACMDLSPAAQIQAWRSVILSASRGDIPPEVRPTGNPSKLSNGPPTLAAHQDLERRVALLERRRPRVGKWVRVNATTRDAFGEAGEHVARVHEAGERWFWWVRVAFAPMVIGEPADTEAEALAAADAVLATWADRVGVKPLPPVPRGGEGQPIGVIGKVRVRWCGLAASPLRTDAEETELHHLGAMLAAVGLETWAPVPRKELPPYPGDEGAS